MSRFLIALCFLLIGKSPTAVLGQAFSYQFIIHDMPAMDFADAEWGDLDLDGDFDLVVSGLTRGQFPRPFASAFINMGETGSEDSHGDSVWTQNYRQLGQGMAQVWMSSTTWLDIDNDGALEMAVTGATSLERPFNPVAKIYRRSGTQLEEIPAGIPGVYGGSIDWGDYDNDGDSDLLLTGETNEGGLTRIFENQGSGSFVEINPGLPDVSIGDARFGDFDLDGDLDILLTGDSGSGFLTALFRNDGGSFTEMPFVFPALAFSSVDWGDYDNDGDPDIVLAGGTLSPLILDGHSYVFRNDGGGAFTDIGAELDGMFYGAAKWGDYDNDGLLDILLSGAADLREQRLGRLYHNEGAGVFRLSINLAGLLFSDAALGDYDGDGDVDLLQVGDGATNQYRNDQLRVNDPPAPPTGLRATSSGQSVTLLWEPGSDEQTPTAGLSYNIRIGTAPGAIDVVSPLANLETGRRLINRLGNVQQNRTWTVTGLPPGTYFWSVQALDNAFNGSPFSEEGMFAVTEAGGVATSNEPNDTVLDFGLTSSYPNPFVHATSIVYTVSEPTHVEVDVFNALGERVRVLSSGLATAGRHVLTWDGRGSNGGQLGAGFYLVRLSDGGRQTTLKVVKVI